MSCALSGLKFAVQCAYCAVCCVQYAHWAGAVGCVSKPLSPLKPKSTEKKDWQRNKRKSEGFRESQEKSRRKKVEFCLGKKF